MLSFIVRLSGSELELPNYVYANQVEALDQALRRASHDALGLTGKKALLASLKSDEEFHKGSFATHINTEGHDPVQRTDPRWITSLRGISSKMATDVI